MKILLDTHILIWFHTNSPELSAKAREMLLNPENDIFYSAVNIWETQVKYLKHSDEMTVSGDELNELSRIAGLRCLPIKAEHCLELKSLRYSQSAPPHKDPFDRILLCQAKAENMFLMTHDSLIPNYNEPCVLSV